MDFLIKSMQDIFNVLYRNLHLYISNQIKLIEKHINDSHQQGDP